MTGKTLLVVGAVKIRQISTEKTQPRILFFFFLRKVLNLDITEALNGHPAINKLRSRGNEGHNRVIAGKREKKICLNAWPLP